MFKIEIDSAKKVFKVLASGVLSKDDLTQFIKEYEISTKKIPAAQYALLIDAREQKAIHPEAAPLLEKVLKLYVDTPFRKRISVVLESAIAMQQVKRVGKDEVQQFSLVTSLDEAYKQL